MGAGTADPVTSPASSETSLDGVGGRLGFGSSSPGEAGGSADACATGRGSPRRPPDDTVEAWAYDYLLATAVAHKLSPPRPPWRVVEGGSPLLIDAPGRPEALRPGRPGRTPRDGALRLSHRRAALLHTFLGHELQAAELFCRAILAFHDTPPAFRRGLARLAYDEARHMRLYAAHLRALGAEVGDFPVGHWFWERVPEARTPASFVALVGLGLEGGNLDHAERFAVKLAAAGDAQAAAIVARIGREEIGHVRFARRWFLRFTGACDYATFAAHLPAPLSPWVLRGRPLARAARCRAGFDDAFCDALEAAGPREGRAPGGAVDPAAGRAPATAGGPTAAACAPWGDHRATDVFAAGGGHGAAAEGRR
jgi:uncharacterized ferritin-like protein (DUF455 family)